MEANLFLFTSSVESLVLHTHSILTYGGSKFIKKKFVLSQTSLTKFIEKSIHIYYTKNVYYENTFS